MATQPCPPNTAREASSGTRRRRLAGFALAIIASLACFGCAGYQLGYRSLFPQDVHTVYVPMFESESFRRHLGERLTEAVIKRIESASNYKVVSDPGADSILTGMIVSDRKSILVQDRNSQPRQFETALVVRVSWTRRDGTFIAESRTVPLTPDMVQVVGAATTVPEVGQSVATAHQQAIDRVARQIVEMMEMPW